MPKPAVLVASLCAFAVPILAVFMMTPQGDSMEKMSGKRPSGTLMYFYLPS